MKLLGEVERLPHERHASLGNTGKAQEIEARPGQERIAAAKGPDLDALRGLDARPAGMEADRVGDDERVGGNCESLGCGEAETGKLVRMDTEGAAGRIAVAVLGRPYAHLLLPGEALVGHEMRARDKD